LIVVYPGANVDGELGVVRIAEVKKFPIPVGSGLNGRDLVVRPSSDYTQFQALQGAGLPL
jgi:hypothetical protein